MLWREKGAAGKTAPHLAEIQMTGHLFESSDMRCNHPSCVDQSFAEMETTSRETDSSLAEMDKVTTVADALPTRTARIGRGLPEDLIEQAREVLEHTPRNEIYRKYEDTPFFYEILEEREVTGRLVQAWIEVFPLVRPPSKPVLTYESAMITYNEQRNAFKDL